MSKKANNVRQESRSQVPEPDEKETSAFVQDLVVALADVYVRLERIWPEEDLRWYKLGRLSGFYVSEFLPALSDSIRIVAEHFDTGINILPSLLEKLGQKHDSEQCPVCQHARERDPKFTDCWYCREGFGPTEELKSFRAKETSKEIRLQVHEREDAQTFAFFQDVIVALADVYVRLVRILPEVLIRWSELGRGCEYKYDEWVSILRLDTREIAEYFDTGMNILPSLLEKLGQKHDSEQCPVCQHARERDPKFRDCWYCREVLAEIQVCESSWEEDKLLNISSSGTVAPDTKLLTLLNLAS